MLPDYAKNQMTPYLVELGLIKQHSTRGDMQYSPMWSGYPNTIGYPIYTGTLGTYGGLSNASTQDPNTTAGAAIPADYGQGVFGDSGFSPYNQ